MTENRNVFAECRGSRQHGQVNASCRVETGMARRFVVGISRAAGSMQDRRHLGHREMRLSLYHTEEQDSSGLLH